MTEETYRECADAIMLLGMQNVLTTAEGFKAVKRLNRLVGHGERNRPPGERMERHDEGKM